MVSNSLERNTLRLRAQNPVTRRVWIKQQAGKRGIATSNVEWGTPARLMEFMSAKSGQPTIMAINRYASIVKADSVGEQHQSQVVGE